MVMAMVGVGIVGVGMGERFVPVPMVMGFAGSYGLFVSVPVMAVVMGMRVFVLQGLVEMLVAVSLGQV